MNFIRRPQVTLVLIQTATIVPPTIRTNQAISQNITNYQNFLNKNNNIIFRPVSPNNSIPIKVSPRYNSPIYMNKNTSKRIQYYSPKIENRNQRNYYSPPKVTFKYLNKTEVTIEKIRSNKQQTFKKSKYEINLSSKNNKNKQFVIPSIENRILNANNETKTDQLETKILELENRVNNMLKKQTPIRQNLFKGSNLPEKKQIYGLIKNKHF